MKDELRDVTRVRLIQLCKELDASPCAIAKALVNLIEKDLVEVDHPGGRRAVIAAIRSTAAELTPGGRCP